MSVHVPAACYDAARADMSGNALLNLVTFSGFTLGPTAGRDHGEQVGKVKGLGERIVETIRQVVGGQILFIAADQIAAGDDRVDIGINLGAF